MSWLEHVNDDPTPWLLEVDLENPGVRYFALKDILDKPPDDPEVVAAQKEVMTDGPVPVILDAQAFEGYWVKPHPGYLPKYRSTVWSVIFLAQLGADGSDLRVQRGCQHLLDNNRSPHGGFSIDGRLSGMIHCLQGNLVAALIDLGWLGDERLIEALDWMARSITGEGIAPSEDKKAAVHYLRSGISGTGFLCSANGHTPCAWGAVKVMLALGKVPESERTPIMMAAIDAGIDLLLGCDPAGADYPSREGGKPNRSWFKFGYPVGYVTDVLQNLEALTALGCGGDTRLSAGMDLVLSKQDSQGRWMLEYTYNGKTWIDVEEKKKPSKWVTLRALRVLKHHYQ
jgi:hypothetical protein